MPRQKPISTQEAAICGRLLEFRNRSGLSRVAFAQKAGVGSSELMRLEHRRTQLRYGTAWRFINAHHINPSWLVNGRGGFWSRLPLPSAERLQVKPGELFSRVYKSRLAKSYDAGQLPPELIEGEDDLARRARFEWALNHFVERWRREVPDKGIDFLLRALTQLASDLSQKYPADPPEVIEERERRLGRSLSADERFRLFR